MNANTQEKISAVEDSALDTIDEMQRNLLKAMIEALEMNLMCSSVYEEYTTQGAISPQNLAKLREIYAHKELLEKMRRDLS